MYLSPLILSVLTVALCLPVVFVSSVNGLDGNRETGPVYITNTTDAELESWVAPEYLRNNYRMDFVGRDEEDRPVWVMNFGKWNFKKIMEAGPEVVQQFDKYIDQITYRIHKSQQVSKEDPEDRADGYILLADMEGFRLYDFHSLDTFRYYRQRAKILDKSNENLEHGIFVNVAALAETLLNAMRPFMGEFFNRIEILGTNRAAWLPKVLKKIPRDVLPRKYGGSNNKIY